MTKIKICLAIVSVCSPFVCNKAQAECVADGSHNEGWKYRLVDGRPCWHAPHQPKVVGAIVQVNHYDHQWSGVSFGPVFGYGWAVTAVGAGATVRIAGVDLPSNVSTKGVILGGEIHLRHQLKDMPWIIGLSNQFASFNAQTFVPPTIVNKLRWMDSIDGWGMYAVNPKLTVGVGLGLSFANQQTNLLDTGDQISTTMTGMNAALHSEIALNRDWNVAGQYQFTEFGKGRDVQALTWSLLYRPPVGEAAPIIP